MIPVISRAETVGCRIFRPRPPPPSGTPSRILCLRLRRAFSSHHVAFQPVDAPSATPELVSPRIHAGVGFSTVIEQPNLINSLLRSIQAQDVQNTWTLVKTLANKLGTPGEKDKWELALANLPQTTFSEILRSLDPLRVGSALDVTYGLMIPGALAQFSSAGQMTDHYGIRKVYKNLLKHMLRLFQARLQTGHQVILSDYQVLLRCAGAACDLRMAKTVWNTMDGALVTTWRSGDAYNEFVSARFLTEPLYCQFDLSRFRVQARNLHNSKEKIHWQTLERLDALRVTLQMLKTDFSGLSPHPADEQKDIMRILRTTGPIERVQDFIIESGVKLDEKIACSMLVALGRTASLVVMRKTILANMFGIIVKKLPRTGDVNISGGRDFPIGSAMRPSERLLDAIVHAFGTNAEIVEATKLVNFVSQRYGIPIPHRTWSALLHWSYVCASKPCSTEWKIAGHLRKIISPRQVKMIWDIMVSEPHRIEPTFEDRSVYVKTLIELGQWDEVIEQMRQAKGYYNHLSDENEKLFLHRLMAIRQVVADQEANGDYYKARIKKHLTWYTIQHWCKKLLQKAGAHRNTRESDFGPCTIPDFVEEFREFMPSPFIYRTTWGRVEIHDGSSIRTEWVRAVSVPPPARLRLPVWERDEEGNKVKDADGRATLLGKREVVIRRPVRRWQRRRREMQKLPWDGVTRQSLEEGLAW